MKVFIAGASGAIGKPILNRLVRENHEIFGMTRSEKRANEIVKIGAVPVKVDALDFNQVQKKIMDIKPDVVIEMLTSLPKEYTPEAMKEAAKRNDILRKEGGANLQKAAILAKAKSYIIQSTAFWYAPGKGLADENMPFAFEASPGIAAGVKVYDEIEKRVLNAENIEGICLRFGFFYGPGTWYAPGKSMANQVKEGNYPILDGGDGVWSFIHVDDAADAVLGALKAKRGIYNITDDTPTKLSVWLPAFARFLNASPPAERSSEKEDDPDMIYYATSLRGASNAKAKKELGFKPRPLEWLNFS